MQRSHLMPLLALSVAVAAACHRAVESWVVWVPLSALRGRTEPFPSSLMTLIIPNRRCTLSCSISGLKQTHCTSESHRETRGGRRPNGP